MKTTPFELHLNIKDEDDESIKKIKNMLEKEYNTEEVINILKCHLIIEHCMNEYLEYKYKDTRLKINKLTFDYKLLLTEVDENSFKALKEFNEIRNRLAHKLEPLDITQMQNIKESITLSPAKEDGYISKHLKEEPILYIIFFTLLQSNSFVQDLKELKTYSKHPLNPQ